jgi:hypothetical protein
MRSIDARVCRVLGIRLAEFTAEVELAACREAAASSGSAHQSAHSGS